MSKMTLRNVADTIAVLKQDSKTKQALRKKLLAFVKELPPDKEVSTLAKLPEEALRYCVE